jgi:hypothetical protein
MWAVLLAGCWPGFHQGISGMSIEQVAPLDLSSEDVSDAITPGLDVAFRSPSVGEDFSTSLTPEGGQVFDLASSSLGWGSVEGVDPITVTFTIEGVNLGALHKLRPVTLTIDPLEQSDASPADTADPSPNSSGTTVVLWDHLTVFVVLYRWLT